MNIVLGRNYDKQVTELEFRVDAMRREIANREKAVSADLELAAGCDLPGWDFAKKIFESEKIRLALLHVKTLVKEDQDQIRGQCLQMERLSAMADEVEIRLAEGMRELEDAKSSLAEELNKLQALRSKR